MAEFQSKFTGQEIENTIDKLRNWLAAGIDGTYPTVTISSVTYDVIWKVIPTPGSKCYGIGLDRTTGRPYEIYYDGSSYKATALDANTDTKNTAGSTNSTSQLYLVGAHTLAENPQTFANNQIYMADGTLYLTNTKDLSGTANNHPALIVGGTDTTAHLELDANEIHAKASGTTVTPLYLNHEGGNTYLSGEKTYSDGTYLYSDNKKVSVEGHTHSFDTITSRGEAFLSWGGKNFSGSYGPIDAAMVPELGANRLAFMPADAVTIEYSRDGGSTWTDYGPTDSQKIDLFNGRGSSFTIGKATSGEGNIATNQYQLRVNIYTSAGRVYTALNKFVIYLSTSGTNNNWCTIRARKQSDYTAGNDTWTTFADKISVSGWSGYNVINTSSITTYGNTASSQYGHIQFIFGCDKGSTNNSYPGLQINKIFGFGGVGWTTPSTMAKTGHMYTYDSSQNVMFPAGVSAKSFTEGGKSLANKYLGKTAKAADADKLDGNDSTYYLNYNNLSNQPTLGTAASKNTGTSPDNVPILDSNGKLADSVIPAVAITDTYVVATEDAMLALSAQKGDIAIRSDLNKSFVLQATPASTLANWKELLTPTDAVLSVNGKTGAVTLNLDNINDGSTRKLANYLPLNGGTMTGNLAFSPVSSTSYPASSNYISWSGSTDGAAIYYRVDASDKGRLVFQTADDSDCNFVWHNTVSGNGDVMTLTGNGNLTVKGDITSNGNKVALDKDVVKLTGDQSINGHKSFTFLSAEYLNGGVINTHPEASGAPAILGYYTNDLVNLNQKGGSCYIKNLTTGAIISESTPYNLFDASPTYYAFSAAQTDVVEIIIKSPVVYNWVTRGGIGFGNTQWGAKDIKIEVGYSPTGTGTAKNTDTDITWATKFNATNNWNEIIFTDLTGPDKANGGTDSSSWNYLKFTLTNFRHTTIHRIAQIFTFNSGSSGLLQTFLPSAGGTLFGGITPYRTNAYYLGTSDKKWAKLYSNEIYGGYIKSDRYLEGVLRSNTGGRVAKLNDIPHYNNENNAANGKMALRLDLAWADIGNKPGGEGFIYTNMWDNANFDTQLYIPNGPQVGTIRPSLRGCNNGTWQTSWTELAYYKDLDNYTKKTITIPDNTSLDTVTESGFYRLSMNPNFPHAQMIVSRGADTIAQMAFPYDTTRMYVRTGNPFNTSGGLWHDWKQVAFTDHTHTSINTAFVFNNNDMPQGSANLSATTNAHQISFYRNGLSVPYQMDNPNDGGILRCRGNSESNVIFELATWDDSGAGETIQFNYYPTNSQVTPTYSVAVPKKTGTILLTTDSSSAGNAEANKVVTRNDAGSIQTEKLAVSSGTTTKATMQYNSTEDCIEFIFA